jgi:hypothetical protein
MNYFDDLSLIWGDEYPRCRSRIDQQFKDCCSLQLSLGGPLSFGIEHKTPMQTDGPLFFWHHPSLNYQYCSIGKGNWHHLWVSFRGPRAMRLIERGFMSLQPEGFVIPRKVEWAAQTMRDLIGLSRSSGKSRASAALLIEELLVWVEEETELETLQQPQSIQKIQMIVRSIQFSPRCGGGGTFVQPFPGAFLPDDGRFSQRVHVAASDGAGRRRASAHTSNYRANRRARGISRPGSVLQSLQEKYRPFTESVPAGSGKRTEG